MINKKVLLKYALWVVSLSVLIGINIYLIQKAFALHTQNVASKKVELFQKVYETRQNLYQQVHSITKNIEQSAHKLSQVGYSNLKKHLKDTAQAIPFISSIGIAFEPYEYNAEEKLFSIYLVKQDGAFTTIDTTQYYNYLNSDWYKQAFITDGAWSKPFTELTTRTSALRFTVPLFRFDTKTNTRIRIGAFFVNISREKLDEFANETIYDPNQYAFILSSEGNLITYPIESYLAEYETLSDVSRLPGKKELHLVSNKIKSMHGGITTYYDSLLHTSFWVAFEPLNISDWFLVYITPKKDIFDIEESRHLILQFSCTLWLLLLFLILSLIQFIHLKKRFWISSTLITLALTSLTFLQLYITLNITPETQKMIIKSNIDWVRFKRFQQPRDKQLRKPDAIYIPTGININSVLIHSINKIEVQGFISQIYGDEAQKLKKEIGFFNAETVKLNPLYQVEKNSKTTMGWSFNAIINFLFDKTEYPFNRLELHLDMYHPNFEKNIILVPDFTAYEQHAISKHIGISKDIVIEKNWNITESYFFYNLSDSQFNFGLPQAIRKEDFPDLSFKIDVQQDVINSLIAYLLPLIIVSIVLFYILIESTMEFRKNAFIEQISLIGQIGALFLALVFAHQTLRNILKISTIAYIEWFYFIMYVFTILIATNCMYIHKSQNAGYEAVLRKQIKYFYWPLIFGSVFIVTLYFFY